MAISGGDVTISASDEAVSKVEAIPDTTGTTGKVGVGASVATNIVANRTNATVADGTTLTTPGSVTISAAAIRDITTKAEAGASGGTSITPALALSLVNNTTTAQLGTSEHRSTVCGGYQYLGEPTGNRRDGRVWDRCG